MINLSLIENVQQLLHILNLVQGKQHNVPPSVVCNGLDGGSLPTAWISVKQKAKSVWNLHFPEALF